MTAEDTAFTASVDFDVKYFILNSWLENTVCYPVSVPQPEIIFVEYILIGKTVMLC